MITVLPRYPKLPAQISALCLCILAFILGGCASDESTNTIEIKPDQLSLSVPNRIREVRELDIENVEAIATVNGQQFELTRTDDQYRVSLNIPTNSSIDISIRFSERLDSGDVLDLAEFSSSLNIGTENQTLQVFEDEFNDSAFDDDNDLISNLIEREEGTDPFVFDTRPDNRTITINFSLPLVINDPQITQVIATIAGTPRAVRRDGNNFEISGIATTSSTVSVEVILLQRLDSGISLALADATRSIPSGVQAVIVELTDDDFNFDRDQDGDGITNLDELQNGTDPTTQN